MELTKEQVQHIESRLVKNGVKYWDIRIEMLDHVVSDVEKRMELGEKFDDATLNSFINLGWNGSLEDLTKSRLFGINKIVRKQYFNQIKKLFTSANSLSVILILGTLYYLTISVSSVKLFKTATLVLLLSPIIFGVFLHFKENLSNKKSGYLTYSSFYIFFSFLLLNAVIQFVKPDGIIPVTKDTQVFVWFVVTALNSVFSYAGILVHLKTLKKVKIVESNLLN
jgi:hypothetical protein